MTKPWERRRYTAVLTPGNSRPGLRWCVIDSTSYTIAQECDGKTEALRAAHNLNHPDDRIEAPTDESDQPGSKVP
jgi:hypothetical protein